MPWCAVFYSAIGAAQPPEKFELDNIGKVREEELFWKAFSEGNYYPDWVFGHSNELMNVAKHPMALWKYRNKEA